MARTIMQGIYQMRLTSGRLNEYLKDTSENANEHAATPPQLMYMVDQMDQIFHEELFSFPVDVHPFSAMLLLNSYTMLAGAVREALSGHISCTYPIARTALESACYGFLIGSDNDKASIWGNRHRDKDSLKRCRQMFTVSNAVSALKPVSTEMAEYVQGLYDASIDFGAHPNQRSILAHASAMAIRTDSTEGFDMTVVYGVNSWHVNHALLACVEVSQAIAFLIAASADHHPLLDERIDVFKNWFEEKNRMAEQLAGRPIDYSGPMYSSVIPPV
ncbi:MULTISPECIES: hypothetical protein [Pseudomonas]|uniref:hypothetical protein n=1 Tax=Pseudomonas TaxID=286 RepID=UPI001C3F3A0C|nr:MULTISPECIES: hypothetical protein [Pseudomonas]WIN08523.1 hypothetical protein QQF68_06660 [Pseudomonas syringae pv. antirrhini str. 126]